MLVLLSVLYYAEAQAKAMAGGRQKTSLAVCTTGISQYACHHHHTNNYYYIRKSLLSCSRDCYFRDGDGGGVEGSYFPKV